jgi:hypothetical protein
MKKFLTLWIRRANGSGVLMDTNNGRMPGLKTVPDHISSHYAIQFTYIYLLFPSHNGYLGIAGTATTALAAVICDGACHFFSVLLFLYKI